MENTLIDAGPIIALFDKDDKFHVRIKAFLGSYSGVLTTTWPVLTEVMYMLDFNVKVQLAFLEWIRRGGLKLYESLTTNIDRIYDLTKLYQNVPMDLADASLVVAAEALNIKKIITINSDYYVYRTMKKEILENVFQA